MDLLPMPLLAFPTVPLWKTPLEQPAVAPKISCYAIALTNTEHKGLHDT